MRYYEDLPDSCPPQDCSPTQGVFFRLIQTDVPSEEDFHSAKLLKKWPKSFKNHSECQASALSVLSTLDAATRYSQLPTLKGSRILELNLQAKDGVAKQTLKDPAHFSWWRSSGFCVRECDKRLVDE